MKIDTKHLREVIAQRAECAGPLTTFDGDRAHVSIITSRDRFDTVIYWLAAVEKSMPSLLDENDRLRVKLEQHRNCAVCIECGLRVKIDEDGCCATCGRDVVLIENGNVAVKTVADHLDGCEREAEEWRRNYDEVNGHKSALLHENERLRAGIRSAADSFADQGWPHIAAELRKLAGEP